jgi:hypothetical protein
MPASLLRSLHFYRMCRRDKVTASLKSGIPHLRIRVNSVSNQVANTARLKHPSAQPRGSRPPVPSEQRVLAIKPGLNGLHEKEIGDRKNRDHCQQR